MIVSQIVSSHLSRASARKCAYAADETNDGTSTERRVNVQDEQPPIASIERGEGPDDNTLRQQRGKGQ